MQTELLPKRDYQPLPSVWEGTDADLLEKMLQFYPKTQPERILDTTANSRRIWKGSVRTVVGMDIDPRYHPEVLGTSQCIPFKGNSIDVIVYDPPHIPNQGKDRQKDFGKRFGLGPKSSSETNYNFAHTFPPFMAEAHRVLRPEGILFCKIADYVHNHRFQWAHVDLITAATAAGFYACDCIVKIRKGPIIDTRWKVAHHARKRHCYWLVFRKSDSCE